MIKLHRLNGAEVVVNAELIEAVEGGPQQTVIIMATNNRFVVKESVTEIIGRTVEYHRTVGLSYVPRPLRREEERNQPCH